MSDAPVSVRSPSDGRRAQPWGRLTPPSDYVLEVGASGDLPIPPDAQAVLAFGNGRSYGDVCSNSRGPLLDGRGLGSILSFDTGSGKMRAGAGVTLARILEVALPHGWFLPVTPGTKYVTVGGAVANDVHGKNHHVAGTFGRHVTALEFARSDGSRITCSPTENEAWFQATVGGLGLTGMILWCELQLAAAPGRTIEVESVRFDALSDFFELSRDADRRFEYTVSWIDCLARGKALGRGWMYCGNHAPLEAQREFRDRKPLPFFLEPPLSLVNALSLKAFNFLYFHRPVPRHQHVDYDPFFYPLDSIRKWNRMYGPRGFFQFQCVVPPEGGPGAVRELLVQTAKHGQGSFLAVLKQFGDLESPGWLSFPRPGPTLALDFPNRGNRTLELMRRLEDVVMEAGGALYPAKDACMAPETFARSFPRWPELEAMRDPAFSSDFWTRVTRGS